MRLRAARILQRPKPKALRADAAATVLLRIRHHDDLLTVTRQNTGESFTHGYEPGAGPRYGIAPPPGLDTTTRKVFDGETIRRPVRLPSASVA